MDSETYNPVPLNLKCELAEAMLRPGFRVAWEQREEAYETLTELLRARKAAGLTQEEMARRMGTTKSAISRLEASFDSEKHSPSFATLRKYARALGKRVEVRLV